MVHEYLYPADSDCDRDDLDDYLHDLLHSIVANDSGSSRDFPASCFRQSLGGTEPLSRDLTAARRSRNRFPAEGVGPELEFIVANLVAHAIEKNDPDFEEFRRKVLALVSETGSPCFENSMGHTLGRAEKASLTESPQSAKFLKV